jgi:hypothetical protein
MRLSGRAYWHRMLGHGSVCDPDAPGVPLPTDVQAMALQADASHQSLDGSGPCRLLRRLSHVHDQCRDGHRGLRCRPHDRGHRRPQVREGRATLAADLALRRRRPPAQLPDAVGQDAREQPRAGYQDQPELLKQREGVQLEPVLLDAPVDEAVELEA